VRCFDQVDRANSDQERRASHIVHSDVPSIAPENWRRNGELVVNVRDPDELEKFGAIDKAVNIPLPQLRDRVDELPRDKKLVTIAGKASVVISPHAFCTDAVLKTSAICSVAFCNGDYCDESRGDVAANWVRDPSHLIAAGIMLSAPLLCSGCGLMTTTRPLPQVLVTIAGELIIAPTGLPFSAFSLR
jgi:hypothetical protein